MAQGAHHLAWHAEPLWQRLEPLLPGLSVEVIARLESTNTELIERARNAGGRRSGDTQPCLLVAEHQTGGRGRQGRDWLASAGASLTFSLALPLAPASWSGLSLAVGVALAEALDPPVDGQPPRIGLKWPNDLWLWEGPGQGRKLGGILIETVAVGTRRLAVVGIGLNVLPQVADGLSQGFACLQEIDHGAYAPQVLATLALPLVLALQRFEAEGLAPFLQAYARRDVLAGQAVHTLGIEPPVAGVAEGIDATGALRVRDAAGLHSIVAGEVSIRLQPGADADAEAPAP
jgi:BirA family biotin operon repressor/biotin-[acetyl-CoA-carboxylase] ligase